MYLANTVTTGSPSRVKHSGRMASRASASVRKETETVVFLGVSRLANVPPSGPWRGQVRGPKWVGMRYMLPGLKVYGMVWAFVVLSDG